MQRHGFFCAAACAALAFAGLARADSPPQLPSGLKLENPAYLAAGDRTPLMYLLDQVGVGKTLSDNNITVGGLAEGSWTQSLGSPPGNFLPGRVFDVDNKSLELNQLMFYVEKTVDASKKQFDVGGRIEFRWGTDSRFIHSLGLFDHQGGLIEGPKNQWDLTQAYVDVAVPIGNGLMVRAGKFVTPMGFETIDPRWGGDASGSAGLFSHSYLFGYAIPFTHTGVTGTYKFSESLTVMAGVTRGWDTSLEDNNGTVDFIGSAMIMIDPKCNWVINVTAGPDQPGDNGNWRIVVDSTLTHKCSDQLTLAINGVYGHEANSVAAADGDDAQWWGAAVYANYKINSVFSLNARGEYFNDDDGVRVGAGGVGLFEATVGLAITPFPDHKWGKNLVIRPEIRYDYATKGFFDGGTDHSQWTAAVDAIFSF